METAADLAKKFGLEYYLDKPGLLNDAIFSLLLLQESLQLERAKKIKPSEGGVISVKRPVHGKFIAACTGDGTYRYAVETALQASTFTVAVFQRRRFIGVLRSMGIPEEKIAAFCDSVMVDDDTHCSDRE